MIILPDTTRTEAVGVFHDAASLQSAADTLMTSGFDRADLSLLASQDAVEKRLGHAYRSIAELEDDPKVETFAYVGGDSLTEAKAATVGGLFLVGAMAAMGAVVASGGTLAAAIFGVLAAGGTGGAIGAVLARFMGKHHAEVLQNQIDKGGILLWVHTGDSDRETRAQEILKANGAEDVHLHALPEVGFEGKAEVYGYLDWLVGAPRPKDQT